MAAFTHRHAVAAARRRPAPAESAYHNFAEVRPHLDAALAALDRVSWADSGACKGAYVAPLLALKAKTAEHGSEEAEMLHVEALRHRMEETKISTRDGCRWIVEPLRMIACTASWGRRPARYLTGSLWECLERVAFVGVADPETVAAVDHLRLAKHPAVRPFVPALKAYAAREPVGRHRPLVAEKDAWGWRLPLFKAITTGDGATPDPKPFLDRLAGLMAP